MKKEILIVAVTAAGVLWHISSSSGQPSYLAKWQKVGDRWLIHAEIFVPTHCQGSDYCDTRP